MGETSSSMSDGGREPWDGGDGQARRSAYSRGGDQGRVLSSSFIAAEHLYGAAACLRGRSDRLAGSETDA